MASVLIQYNRISVFLVSLTAPLFKMTGFVNHVLITHVCVTSSLCQQREAGMRVEQNKSKGFYSLICFALGDVDVN